MQKHHHVMCMALDDIHAKVHAHGARRHPCKKCIAPEDNNAKAQFIATLGPHTEKFTNELKNAAIGAIPA